MTSPMRAPDQSAALHRVPTRIPPHHNASEQAVLSSMLYAPDAVVVAGELLLPDDFYKLRHRVIFETILGLSERREPVDLITVETALEAAGKLEEVGGHGYLVSLFDVTPTAVNIEHYATQVKRCATLRALIEMARTVEQAAFEDDDPEAVLEKAERAIFQAGQTRTTRPYLAMREVMSQTYALVERNFDAKQDVTGVPSGLTDLDRLTRGWQPGDLVILAGRPSMGKTAAALTFAVHSAAYAQVPTLVFSQEMPSVQLGVRALSAEARIDGQLLQTGRFNEHLWPSITMAAGHLSEAPLYIDDSPSPSLREIRSKARRLKAEAGLGLVIIDYLQLMELRDKRAENRQNEVAMLSKGLKALARELGVPFIVLSQLSRKVEERTEKRPVMSDLRDSGAVEQDADVVIFCYRAAYYQHNLSPEEARIAELIVEKQRNGPRGVTVRCFFDDQFGRWANLTSREDEQ